MPCRLPVPMRLLPPYPQAPALAGRLGSNGLAPGLLRNTAPRCFPRPGDTHVPPPAIPVPTMLPALCCPEVSTWKGGRMALLRGQWGEVSRGPGASARWSRLGVTSLEREDSACI